MSIRLPPYVINADLATGFEPEIVKSAFAKQGVRVDFKFMHSSLLVVALRNRSVDGVVLLKSYKVAEKVNHPIYESHKITEFENFAISLHSNHYQVKGFRGAKFRLGPEFSKEIELKGTTFIEQKSQTTLVKVLVGGRYDFLIADRRMFIHWFTYLKNNGGLPKTKVIPTFDFFGVSTDTPHNVF